MERLIFLLAFSWMFFFDVSALFLKNDTNQAVDIVFFADAQGRQFAYIPTEIQPKETVEIQNISYNNNQCQKACLDHLTMVMRTGSRKHAFIMIFSARDLAWIYSGIRGLTFGIPENRKELRRNYKMQEKFPGQLNVRIQNIASMKSC